MVSAIIPVYHNEQIAYQNCKNLSQYVDEIIIVLDGYESENNYLLSRYAKIYHVLPDIPWGNSIARNHGARQAKGDYLLFIDVDSTLKSGISVPLEKGKFYKFKRIPDETYPEDIKKTVIWHCNSMLMHKDVFWSVGGYEEHFAGNYGYEDKYLEFLLLRQYECVNLETEVMTLKGGGVHLERNKEINKQLFEKLKQWTINK